MEPSLWQELRSKSGRIVWEGNCVYLIYTHIHTHVHVHTLTHAGTVMFWESIAVVLRMQSIDSIFHQIDQGLSAQYRLAPFHFKTISIPLLISLLASVHWLNLCAGSYPLSIITLFWYLSELIFLARRTDVFLHVTSLSGSWDLQLNWLQTNR